MPESETVGVKRCARAWASRRLSRSREPRRQGNTTPKPTLTWKSCEGANVQVKAFAT